MKFKSCDVGFEQIRLINRAREFLEEQRKHGLDTAIDPQCYLNSWARVPGNARLRRLAFGWRAEPSRLVVRVKDAAQLLLSAGYIVSGQHQGAKDFDHLVISWALPSDFSADGSYTDRYLGVASVDTPRVLWFLVLLSGPVPTELPRNVCVFHSLMSSSFSAPVRFAANLSRLRRGLQIGGDTFKHCVSGIFAHAQSVAAAVEEQICGGHFRQVVMPYEAQPFQHAINLVAKAIDPNIVTLGYLHSALPPLPTDYLFRPGAPDRLLTNGYGQAEILCRYLGWPTERLKAIPSLRYKRDHSVPLAGRVLLPYAFEDADAIARTVEQFMRIAPESSMPRWEVRNHPVMAQSSKHLALSRRLQTIIERYSSKMSSDQALRQQTMIIGATAAVLEALERGLEVVHICGNSVFEAHSTLIWTHMRVERLSKNVYRYQLRDPGSYIKLNDRDDSAIKQLGINA